MATKFETLKSAARVYIHADTAKVDAALFIVKAAGDSKASDIVRSVAIAADMGPAAEIAEYTARDMADLFKSCNSSTSCLTTIAAVRGVLADNDEIRDAWNADNGVLVLRLYKALNKRPPADPLATIEKAILAAVKAGFDLADIATAIRGCGFNCTVKKAKKAPKKTPKNASEAPTPAAA